jgi:hypothetical protein
LQALLQAHLEAFLQGLTQAKVATAHCQQPAHTAAAAVHCSVLLQIPKQRGSCKLLLKVQQICVQGWWQRKAEAVLLLLLLQQQLLLWGRKLFMKVLLPMLNTITA